MRHKMSLKSYRFIERPAPAGAPLFFTFHGTGGDEHQFFELAHRLVPNAHIIAVRGNVSEHGALRFFRRKAEGVYDMDDLAIRTKSMADFVAAHKTSIHPSRVIGLGYSNGANILAYTLCAVPKLFDDVVLMHPLVPEFPSENIALLAKRVLITAGKRDPICPAQKTESLAAYFQNQGADVTLQWHEGGHELQQTEVEFAKMFLTQTS
jgi:phospholipase/carboxylesterase